MAAPGAFSASGSPAREPEPFDSKPTLPELHGLPPVERRLADPMSMADIATVHATLMFLQNAGDFLIVGISLPITAFLDEFKPEL